MFHSHHSLSREFQVITLSTNDFETASFKFEYTVPSQRTRRALGLSLVVGVAAFILAAVGICYVKNQIILRKANEAEKWIARPCYYHPGLQWWKTALFWKYSCVHNRSRTKLLLSHRTHRYKIQVDTERLYSVTPGVGRSFMIWIVRSTKERCSMVEVAPGNNFANFLYFLLFVYIEWWSLKSLKF